MSSVCSASAMGFAVIGYGTCSSLMLVVNKLAVHFLPAPSFLLFAQFFSSWVAVKLCGLCGPNGILPVAETCEKLVEWQQWRLKKGHATPATARAVNALVLSCWTGAGEARLRRELARIDPVDAISPGGATENAQILASLAAASDLSVLPSTLVSSVLRGQPPEVQAPISHS